MRFCDYTPTDLDEMYALDVACFEPPFRFSRSALLRFAQAANAHVELAKDEEALVAFSILHVERSGTKRIGYIVTIDVAHEHRRQGLARELLARIERQGTEAGCARMVLHVHVANHSAIRLYECAGYECTEVASAFYGLDVSGKPLDAFVYGKALFGRVDPAHQNLKRAAS